MIWDKNILALILSACLVIHEAVITLLRETSLLHTKKLSKLKGHSLLLPLLGEICRDFDLSHIALLLEIT